MRLALALILLLSCGAQAHEWTPTYYEWEPSYISGVVVTKMKLFNRREDVNYYEVEVLDQNMNPVPFVTQDQIVNVEYLDRAKLEIYIRNEDRSRVVYVCSRSKFIGTDESKAVVSSRICSKVK